MEQPFNWLTFVEQAPLVALLAYMFLRLDSTIKAVSKDLQGAIVENAKLMGQVTELLRAVEKMCEVSTKEK